MERKQLRFHPKFDGPIKGWAVNYINKNIWRVEQHLGFDDLLQDAFEYFLICKNRYSTAKNAKHFMSLFQTCFRNHFHDLARSRERNMGVLSQDILFTDNMNEDLVLMEYLHGPSIISDLAAMLANPNTPDNTKKKSKNDYWCELLGIDSDINLRDIVVGHFHQV